MITLKQVFMRQEHITSLYRHSWWEMTNLKGIVWRRWWLIIWELMMLYATDVKPDEVHLTTAHLIWDPSEIHLECSTAKTKLHGFLMTWRAKYYTYCFWGGELLINCFYFSDNTICLAWMICSDGKGGNKKRWDKVSISCSDRTQAVFRPHWRQTRALQ